MPRFISTTAKQARCRKGGLRSIQSIRAQGRIPGAEAREALRIKRQLAKASRECPPGSYGPR